MAKRKSGGRKTQKKRKSGKKFSLKTQLKRITLGIALLVFLVVAVGVLVHYLVPWKRQMQPTSNDKKAAVARKTSVNIPAFEIYPQKEILIREPAVASKKKFFR